MPAVLDLPKIEYLVAKSGEVIPFGDITRISDQYFHCESGMAAHLSNPLLANDICVMLNTGEFEVVAMDAPENTNRFYSSAYGMYPTGDQMKHMVFSTFANREYKHDV